MLDEGFLEFAADDSMTGFRLKRIELYNWGTFHDKVWVLPMEQRNALLTGDIGSGKSTVVDAITTLLVPANRISYNKAAGAEFRERDLRSYVLGYYKSERSETGYSAKPVALRDRSAYSVVLGVFHNAGFEQTVTLAQVFHQKEAQGQPTRFYVVSDRELSIAEHFSEFGSDLTQLRKRIRNLPHTEPIFDSFPAYGAAFRRRFGLQGEQALELFHQTVSMKAVGNLTAFVREHMLESFDVSERIEALITHFDDLNRAHEAVLRAKDQIGRLKPLVERLDAHAAASTRRAELLQSRDGLRVYFAYLKEQLLDTRIANLEHSATKERDKRDRLQQTLGEQRAERDEIKRAIAENGGDRIENLKTERAQLEQEKDRRLARFEDYRALCEAVEFPARVDADGFRENREAADSSAGELKAELADLENRRSEHEVGFRRLREEHAELSSEIESLQSRKSNIDSQQVKIRDRLCEELDISDERLPFAGELIMVREDARDWEGAIERVMRNFALSLLVPDELYAQVAEWVDATHLRGRLVYYRVLEDRAPEPVELESASLLHKLELKPNNSMHAWLEHQLQQRFDYTCCETLQEFRRARRGLTKAGQVKGSALRHEKDDRHRLQDRSRYVLGWRNEEKIEVISRRARTLEQEMQELGSTIAELRRETEKLEDRRRALDRLHSFAYFEDIHWQPAAARIEAISSEIARLESDSDVLQTLSRHLEELEARITASEQELDSAKAEIARLEDRLAQAREQREQARELLQSSDTPPAELAERIEPLRTEVLGEHRLTVESCDNRQQELREAVQAKIDAEDKRIRALHERIVTAMQDFRREYPAETREMDAALDSAAEFRELLARLLADDLPRFEARFKALLNENTIREIANFQAQLNKECQIIKERVERINRSMSAIEFNKDRYILLEAQNSTDSEIRSFKQELKSCTEGSFTGSQDEQYTESKYLQVKSIIDRFKGREGAAELDRRWTEKVTDVRNWFAFAASERWKEDDTEYEHYTDSGGKSGGQKEKLAYTVLAASLAYQFGLEWGETRSRSFRFVVIDEAFGKGSDESTRYGLRLFKELNLQLLIITPLQKIHIIEPYVSTVGFVHSQDGKHSLLRCLTIEEYEREKQARRA